MIADVYPLSPLQAGMIFHAASTPGSVAYFNQFSCELRGRVDAARLGRAWQELVDRHDILRTSFHWEGLAAPVQVVRRQATLPWEALDWRHLSREEQTAAWDARLARDRTEGFDLERAPLMRCTLARLGEDRHAFCWSHHHLLLDGWCLSLVLVELFERYEAIGEGRRPSSPSAARYGDYIRWLQARDPAASARFWRDHLRGLERPTPLPGRDAPPEAGRGETADGLVTHRVSAGLTADLRALTARHRLTLNTLLQGAWGLLLSRYSGERDVAFGTTVSGRPPELPGSGTMLGVFINTVPVRLEVAPDTPIHAWLGQLQRVHLEREVCAAASLSDIQKWSDVPSGIPLFESALLLQNYRMDDRVVRGAAGIEIADVRILDRTDIPLTVQITPGDALEIECVYDARRFEPAVIDRLPGHLEQVLRTFADGLDRPLSSVEILTPAERDQLFLQFNATDAPLDRTTSIVARIEAQAAAHPDRLAVACGGTHVAYGALNARANRLAREMLERAPIGPGDLVAIAVRRSEAMVVAILAAWKCGAAYVPVDPDYPAERIRAILDDAAPRLVFRDDGAFDPAFEAELTSRMPVTAVASLEEAAAERDAANVGRTVAGDGLAYVIFTSGSTGRPKGAMVEHTGLLNHVLAKIEDLGVTETSIIAQNASHCFDISVWQFFTALAAGGTTVVYTDATVLDPDDLLREVHRDRVSILEVVPSYLAALLDRLEGGSFRIDDLRWLLVTGEVVKPSLVERWFRAFPHIPVVNAYGPTEAADDITHHVMLGPPDTPSVPVGRPIRNCHIYVVTEQLNLCPVGIKGELCVSGPGVGRGYLNDPERTARVFLDDPFRADAEVRMYRTGDVASYMEDGTLLLFGRRDYQVKVRGHRIELGDIEAALTALDGVRDAAVVDRQDRERGTYLSGYVTLHEAAALAPETILDLLAARVPGYMVPATCTVLSEMPLTPNGKIDRKALPAPRLDERRASDTYVPPRTSIETRLARIWADVLGVEQPGIHDNFFALGGDSILSMQIVSRGAREGLALTPRLVFQHQTIAELAEVATSAEAASPRPVAPSGPVALAPAQAAFFEQVTVDRHHYNQSLLIEVPEPFDPQAGRAALAAIIARHDALRLRFAEVGGRWQQQVAAAGADLPWTDHDLSGAPPDARSAAIDAAGERLQASLDLSRGPLLRAAYFHAGSRQPGRLLLVVHHLAVDGVSWRVLMEDFATAYQQCAAGEAVALEAPPPSYLAWAAGQAGHGVPVPIVQPVSDPANTVASQAEVSIVLDAALADALAREARRVYRTSATDLFAAATAMAMARHTGTPAVGLDIETHGRDVGDYAHTVGWFTRTMPVVVQTRAGGIDIDLAIISSKEARAQAGSTAASAPPGPAPVALVNYHGRADQDLGLGWRLSPDAHGGSRSARQAREYRFEVNGLVTDRGFEVVLAFSHAQHEEAHARALVEAIGDRLHAVIAYCAGQSGPHLTPSDVPAARLAQDALDVLAARVADAADIYELSPTQQGMLFHALHRPGTEAYFNQLTCELTGPLDVSLFREAWRRVVLRHEALRTSFHWKDLDHPVQVVHRDAEAPWSVEDWRGEAPAAQDIQWLQRAADDRARPFDLSHAPLMRFALCRTAGERYRFRWSQHHLLLDGWSSAIVLGEVVEMYDALVGGRDAVLVAAPPFRLGIDWLQRQDTSAAERYWRATLDGVTGPTPLLLGGPEMEGQVGPSRMEESERVLSPALSAALRAAAVAEQVTLNTLFQAAWAIALSRQSGETDVVSGAIVSGRPSALSDADRMVGVFINTIPVRVRVDDGMALGAWLRRLQRDAAEREAYEYCTLADVQRWSGVNGGTPLIDSIVIFENYPVGQGLRQRRGAIAIDAVRGFEPNNYPMTFVVSPGDTVALKVMYDAGRYDAASIARMLDRIETLLTGMTGAAATPLGQLPFLTADEEARILRSWNDTGRAGPDVGAIVPLIEAHAKRTPAAVALRCGDRHVSYGDLSVRTDALAGRLQAQGVTPGSRVAVCLGRSDRLIETVLAIWKCGAAYVPVDPAAPAERSQLILGCARPVLVVDQPHEDADLAGHPLSERARLGRDDLAYVIFTSGSSGVPKGAMVEHGGMLNHILSMVEDLGLDEASVVAQTASHGFDISIWQMFAALVGGGTTVVYPEALVLQPQALAARLDADGVTAVQFVPSYLNVFMDEVEAAANRPALAALSWMVLIGEALKPATVGRWFDLYPRVPMMNAYGPTEASDSIAHHVMPGPAAPSVVPIGRPIRNMAIYVLDPAGRLCAPGVKGEICVSGAGVGRGYLDDAVRTAEVFCADPFVAGARMYRTGDIGCYTPGGTLLFFGRRDTQIKVRGHRIELGEIEAALAALPGVRDAVVIARPDARDELVLHAFVTGESGARLDERDLAERLSNRLPGYAVPEALRIAEHLPLLPSGKVDRRALAATPFEPLERAVSGVPATDTERQLLQIWRDVLDRSDLGTDDGFFDAGGHSLKAIQVAGRIARDCGVEIGIGDVLECGTVRQLARRVDEAERTADRTIPVLPERPAYPASPTQKRLWLASQTVEGAVALNMWGAFTLDGDVDAGLLEQSLRAVVGRHESLRTTFGMRAGVLEQRVGAESGLGPLLSVVDAPPAELDPAGVRAIVEREAREPFDLARGPLIRAVLAGVSAGRHVLVLCLHHTIGDALSIQVVLRELAAVYEAAREGRPDPLAPLLVQYRDVAAWSEGRLARARARNREYWTRVLSPMPTRTGFASDGRGDAAAKAAAEAALVADVVIDRQTADRLRARAARHETTLFAVLAAGVLALLHRSSGHEDIVVGTQVSRRDHPQVEGQVGCYIDTMVLRAQVGAADRPDGLTMRVGQTLREALVHQEYAFDALLEDLRMEVTPGVTPLFDVLVNYVPGGLPAAADGMHGLRISDLALPMESVQYETSVLVTDDGAGGLAVRVVASAAQFDARAVEALGDRLARTLQWLAGDGGCTVGEIPLVDRPSRKAKRLRIALKSD